MPPIKLVAVDIDGTLLNSQFNVSKANVRALLEAHRAGIHVVLATGRRHTFAMPIAERLGFQPHIISSNGAMACAPSGEVITSTFMPRRVARALLNEMEPFAALAVLTFNRNGRGALVLQSRDASSPRLRGWLEKNAEYVVEVDPLQDSLTEDPIQIMYCADIKQMEHVLALLTSTPAAKDVTCSNTRYAHRDMSLVDVLPRGCTKGHALSQLAASLGVAADEIAAIGDNGNDREMLAFAGHAFVVENGVEELKRCGWTVVRSNDDDGVAHALELALRAAVEA